MPVKCHLWFRLVVLWWRVDFLFKWAAALNRHRSPENSRARQEQTPKTSRKNTESCQTRLHSQAYTETNRTYASKSQATSCSQCKSASQSLLGQPVPVALLSCYCLSWPPSQAGLCYLTEAKPAWIHLQENNKFLCFRAPRGSFEVCAGYAPTRAQKEPKRAHGRPAAHSSIYKTNENHRNPSKSTAKPRKTQASQQTST